MTTDYYNTNPDGTRCTSWIQDPVSGKLIPRSRYKFADLPRRGMDAILKPMEEFRSVIDGQVISCRGKLRAHNAKHSVTNAADYSPEYLERRSKQRLAQQKREDKAARVENIQASLYRHGHRS